MEGEQQEEKWQQKERERGRKESTVQVERQMKTHLEREQDGKRQEETNIDREVAQPCLAETNQNSNQREIIAISSLFGNIKS